MCSLATYKSGHQYGQKEYEGYCRHYAERQQAMRTWASETIQASQNEGGKDKSDKTATHERRYAQLLPNSGQNAVLWRAGDPDQQSGREAYQAQENERGRINPIYADRHASFPPST
jgi:hypothetical protein